MTVKSESEDGKDTELNEDGTKKSESEDGKTEDEKKEDEKKEEDRKKAEQEEKDGKKSESPKNNSEATAKGEINSFQAKINSGKATKEEAPQWMQNDLQDKKEEPTEADLTVKITAKLKDDAEFEKLQEGLPEDLDEETTEKMNLIIEREIKLGKTSSEAFKYATYECGIPMPHNKSDAQIISDAHQYPKIKPRVFKKKETLINTQEDKDYVEMVKEETGVDIS